ncbi:MAG: PIN domain-containing protein [Acidobacteria bacterium]|nr:PIN domain-containing protein [Acidobacteriota bacterium]MCI0590135.1 PIN domain-containing protein [Gammaproteobacteria bacterium]
MPRTILIDANVIDEINRGNDKAANALLGMIRNGDKVYISQQAYNELIVNSLPRQATANRIVLERLNINLAPAGPMATRVDVYSQNQTRTGSVLSEPDSLVAAQARANGAELWSFDGPYRTNAAVTNRLGVQVAPECRLSLAETGSGLPPQADYRVGHRLLGLPPVEINISGQVVRRGPPGSPPGAPGTPPAAFGGGGGGTPASGRGGTSASNRGGTTAVVGVADNRLPQVGGPSPRGTAIGGGIQLAFQGINFVLNLINDSIQEQRVREALAQIEPSINRERAANRSLGVLLIFYFHQTEAPPESLIRPGAVFSHLENATGRSLDEARSNWARQPALRPGTGPNRRTSTQEIWIPPVQPVGVAALRTPFPPSAVGTFASGAASKLQDVEWGGVTGFDDEGETTLQLRAGSTPPEFVILRPPAVIHWFNGTARYNTDIPLVTRTTSDGSDLTVVDLDPWMPGNVSAAMVFAADDATDHLFVQGPPNHDNLNQLRGYVNIGKLRWVRPEYICILRRLQ